MTTKKKTFVGDFRRGYINNKRMLSRLRVPYPS
jgi:hypothetical protein